MVDISTWNVPIASVTKLASNIISPYQCFQCPCFLTLTLQKLILARFTSGGLLSCFTPLLLPHSPHLLFLALLLCPSIIYGDISYRSWKCGSGCVQKGVFSSCDWVLWFSSTRSRQCHRLCCIHGKRFLYAASFLQVMSFTASSEFAHSYSKYICSFLKCWHYCFFKCCLIIC